MTAKRLASVSLVLVAAGLSACPGSNARDRADEAARLLARYVAAVNKADVGTAMSLRCRPARVPQDERQPWADQAKRLTDSLGPLRVSHVRELRGGAGLRPVGGLRAAYHVAFRVVVGGTQAREDLIGVVVREKGSPRLCGSSTYNAGRFHAGIPTLWPSVGESLPELSGYMPETAGDRYHQVEDGPKKAEGDEVEAWSRAWQFESYGGARVAAKRYQTEAAASRGAHALLDGFASDSVQRISDPEMPGAVGFRYLGFAWLWVQPPDHGPFIDVLAARFGNTVVLAIVSNLTRDDDGARCRDLLRAAAGRRS